MNSRLLSSRLPSVLASPGHAVSAARHPFRRTTRAYSQTLNIYPTFTARSLHLPRILDPGTYRPLIPKAFRKDANAGADGAENGEGNTYDSWIDRAFANPATFYILIFSLIGSQAIHMLYLRKETENFYRLSDARIRVLQDVIGKLQRGEDVDVKRMLGTGEERQEKEWQDEIEEEEEMWRWKKAKEVQASKASRKASAATEESQQKNDGNGDDKPSGTVQTTRKPMFF
ncbi:hypothetical protein KEM55_004899 [Ascosphaera atra]|nr:hypothetical protein KEM55_004899 [Ascosphaera atra]